MASWASTRRIYSLSLVFLSVHEFKSRLLERCGATEDPGVADEPDFVITTRKNHRLSCWSLSASVLACLLLIFVAG